MVLYSVKSFKMTASHRGLETQSYPKKNYLRHLRICPKYVFAGFSVNGENCAILGFVGVPTTHMACCLRPQRNYFQTSSIGLQNVLLSARWTKYTHFHAVIWAFRISPEIIRSSAGDRLSWAPKGNSLVWLGGPSDGP